MLIFLIGIVGFLVGFITTWIITKQYNKKRDVQIARIQNNNDMLNQWLILKQNEISLDRILKEKGIFSIAIYGMGITGRHLVRELENKDVKIAYGIDMKINKPYKNISIFKLQKEMETVDAVINTVDYDKQNIIDKLHKYYTCPIFNLDELIYANHFTDIEK